MRGRQRARRSVVDPLLDWPGGEGEGEGEGKDGGEGMSAGRRSAAHRVIGLGVRAGRERRVCTSAFALRPHGVLTERAGTAVREPLLKAATVKAVPTVR